MSRRFSAVLLCTLVLLPACDERLLREYMPSIDPSAAADEPVPACKPRPITSRSKEWSDGVPGSCKDPTHPAR
jgi:hypothetical protein